jgi:hypothetical protein
MEREKARKERDGNTYLQRVDKTKIGRSGGKEDITRAYGWG